MILQAVQTDLRAFLKPVAAAYDSLAQSKEISFDFEMEENISLYLDPEKMEKILHNILSNAFKFTEKGGRISITRSEEHTSELQSLMRISYAVFCLKKKNKNKKKQNNTP